MHRFYIPAIGTENHIWLDKAESRHLRKVLRLREGDAVALFDGSGIECLGTIELLDRDRTLVAVSSRERVDRDPCLDLTVACAVVKAKAMDLVVAKSAELGVRQVIPVETARSVPKVADKEASHLDRWARIAIESSKQCGRTTVTRIAPPRPLRTLLEKADEWDLRLAFVAREDARLKAVLSARGTCERAIGLVGPEGGFEAGEVEAAEAAGFVPVRLGRSVLRTETAVAAAAAVLLYHFDA